MDTIENNTVEELMLTIVHCRNTDLFFKIADIIDFTPEQYAQETWGEYAPTQEDKAKFEAKFNVEPGNHADARWSQVECGTKMCVAGWAAQLSGYLPYVTTKTNHDGEKMHVFDWGSVNKREDLLQAQPTHGTALVAAKLLGITHAESDILFHGDYEWTSDDLRAFGKGKEITWYGPVDGEDDD